jgi:hypothetical protein
MQDQGDPQFEPSGAFHYFRKAVEVVKLDKAAMAQVAQDSNSIRFGIGVTAIGGVLAVLPDSNLIGIAVAAIYSVIAIFVFAGFVHLIAGYSMGKEQFLGLVRIIALSGIIDWAALIPLAGLFAAIWSIVVAVVATRQVYHLARGKAILSVLVSVCALWLITATLFAGPMGSLYTGTEP